MNCRTVQYARIARQQSNVVKYKKKERKYNSTVKAKKTLKKSIKSAVKASFW
jgi:hypothetical protein